MKKLFLLISVFLACSLFAIAGSPVVGSWDCVAVADMDYPFVLKFVEKDGILAGTAETNQGDAGAVKNVKLEEGILTFSIDTYVAGMVEFKAKLEGDTLEGTFDTYDFGGEFTGKRQK